MLPINSAIFKAYDIRGIYGQDFDDEMAYLLGQAYVALRQQDPDYRTGQKLRIAVASDMRLSSPALKDSLIRGLLAAGADAVDLGLAATPTFYFAVGHFLYDGGIMVSASHNPKEWNGFKLVRSQGRPISGESGINFLREQIMLNDFRPAETPGKLEQNNRALEAEIAYSLTWARREKIKPLTVVADAANGMGATYLQALARVLPINLVPLNFELDGTFPAHEADPLKPENIEPLCRAVIKHQANLGIATDGDGDRVFFVDNKGKAINQAIIRGLLAKIFAADRPGTRLGYDVRPGKITADLIREGGGQPVLTRVGHSLIKEQMLKEDIYFAGESSGHFFLRGEAGCFEYPAIMILKLLEYFSSFDDIAAHLQTYEKYWHSGEINRTVLDVPGLYDRLALRYADGAINRLDGFTVEYPDFWFNVRGSNTEPKVRLNLEAISPEIMAEKRDEVLALMV